MTAARLVREELERLGLKFPSAITDQLQSYVAELEHWNRSMNLTALQGRNLIRKLVAEPVWIGQQLQLSGRTMDVGSGNGSPGIPLYATCSSTIGHLVESRAKRAAFLRHVVSKLNLKNVFVEESRIEELSSFAPRADWITLQAVRFSSELGETLSRFSGPATKAVWITSGAEAPASLSKKLQVPESKTEVWVFGLDQFCPQ